MRIDAQIPAAERRNQEERRGEGSGGSHSQPAVGLFNKTTRPTGIDEIFQVYLSNEIHWGGCQIAMRVYGDMWSKPHPCILLHPFTHNFTKPLHLI